MVFPLSASVTVRGPGVAEAAGGVLAGIGEGEGVADSGAAAGVAVAGTVELAAGRVVGVGLAVGGAAGLGLGPGLGVEDVVGAAVGVAIVVAVGVGGKALAAQPDKSVAASAKMAGRSTHLHSLVTGTLLGIQSGIRSLLTGASTHP
jgi:hypothetical protein